jgi:hypothetical protein
VGLAVRHARWAICAATLVALISLSACAAGLGINSGWSSSQGQPPSSIVVIFKTGVPLRQAKSEVRSCHPLHISGGDTTRHHSQAETAVFFWGPDAGTAGAKALYDCIKAIPGVASQSWSG